tara:strand:+ start:1925 stop:3991 length:2067 start_codon:yes stop_codon:yes gene_type:complete
MTVKIERDGEALRIIGDKKEEFFKNSRNKNFFTSNAGFGFEILQKGNEIIWEGIVEEESDFNEILEYLDTEQQKTKADTSVKKIASERKRKKIAHNELRQLGKKIKTTTAKIHLNGVAKGFELLKFQTRPVKLFINILSKEGGQGIANFSVPGAGKTVMTYATFNELKRKDIIDQLWVIGPVTSFKPWEDEYETIFGKVSNISEKIFRYHGFSSPSKRIGELRKTSNYDIILTSYGTAGNDRKLLANHWEKSGKKILLVLDESHHIKEIKEKTKSGGETSAVEMKELGRYAEKRCILSGTPMPHSWNDLYHQFKFLYPNDEIFGTRQEYQALTEEEIEEKILSFWDRVGFNQLKKKLPKIEKPIILSVPMNTLQEQIYDDIESDLAEENEGPDKWTLEEWKQAKIVRTLQAVTNPRLILENDEIFQIPAQKKVKKYAKRVEKIRKMAKDPKQKVTPKIKKACEIAECLINGTGKWRSKDGKKKNVIIYTLFRGNVDVIGSDDQNEPGYLAHYDPICVTGQLKDKDRENRIKKFKDWNPDVQKQGKVLVATVSSIAEAVSLHKNDKGEAVCQHVIYLERNYNAGQFMQSKYRVYRIGSDKRKPIQYYFLKSIYRNGLPTIDLDVNNRLAEREKRMHRVLNDPMHLAPIEMEVEDNKDKNTKKKVPWDTNDSHDDIIERVKKLREKKSRK